MGELAARVGQSPVLGELVAGVLVGQSVLGLVHETAVLKLLGEIGVMLLLFEVGLESTVGQMMKVGLSALVVATAGIVAPFALGWGVGAWLLPDESVYMHAFLGATLTATSVGITAQIGRAVV